HTWNRNTPRTWPCTSVSTSTPNSRRDPSPGKTPTGAPGARASRTRTALPDTHETALRPEASMPRRARDRRHACSPGPAVNRAWSASVQLAVARGELDRLQDRQALHVVGHREGIEGAELGQPVLAPLELGEVASERGRVAGDVGDRTRAC